MLILSACHYSRMMFFKICFTLIFVVFGVARELPDYIKPCKLSDANFQDCAVSSGNNALPSIVKGDDTFKIPNLSPIIIPEVNIENGDNLKVKFTDIHSDSLSGIKVNKFSLDEKANVLRMTLTADSLVFLGNYDMSGHILILPINGNGRCNVTYADGTYYFNMTYKTIEKNDLQYLDVVDATLDFTTKRGYFRFENLFNGDQRLGEEMNKFIDENWQDFSGEIKPAVIKTMASVIANVFRAYFRKVPKDQIFLP